MARNALLTSLVAGSVLASSTAMAAPSAFDALTNPIERQSRLHQNQRVYVCGLIESAEASFRNPYWCQFVASQSWDFPFRANYLGDPEMSDGSPELARLEKLFWNYSSTTIPHKSASYLFYNAHLDDDLSRSDYRTLMDYYNSATKNQNLTAEQVTLLKADQRLFGFVALKSGGFESNPVSGLYAIFGNLLLDRVAPVANFDARKDQYHSGDFFLDQNARPSFHPFLSLKLRVLAAQDYLLPADKAEQRVTEAAKMLRTAYGDFVGDMDNIGLRLRLRSISAAEEERVAAKERNTFAVFSSMLLGIVASELNAPPNILNYAMMSPIDAANKQNEQQQIIVRELTDRLISSIPQSPSIADDGIRFPLVRITQRAHGDADPAGNPLQNVIRIVTRGAAGKESLCSGAFTENNRVLTAQHCLVDKGGQVRQIVAIRWEYKGICKGPNGYGLCDRALSFTPLSVQHSPKAWTDDWSHDWSVIQLKEDITQFGFVPSKVADPSTKDIAEAIRDHGIIIGGYSGDLNDGQEISVHWGCKGETTARLLNHQCRGWKGLSGSPIFIASGPYKGRIVGVQSYAFFQTSQLTGEALKAAATRGGGPSANLFMAAVTK